MSEFPEKLAEYIDNLDFNNMDFAEEMKGIWDLTLEELGYMTPIQATLFKELSKGMSLTRKDFVEKFNRARTTIYDNLQKLEKRKLIRRFVRGNGLRGRPITFWYIPKYLLHDLFKKIGEGEK